MKKQIAGVLWFALLVSGCASNRVGNPAAIGAGAVIGGTVGSAVGGLIGESHRGWRGGYRGSAIGTIVGAVAGAAVGHAATTPKADKGPDIYIPRTVPQEVYTPGPSERQRPATPKTNVTLRLQKIRFIDDSRNQTIDAGESSKVIFEVMNEGRESAYNVLPIVEQISSMKHITISPSVMIEEIAPGEGIRYTATILAGEKLKAGEATFRIAVADEQGTMVDAQTFTLPTRKRE